LAFLSRSNDGVYDWNEETERFSRPGPGRDYETVFSAGFGDGLSLMLMEPDRLGSKSEDMGGLGTEVAGFGKIADCLTGFVTRVERKQRFRPEPTLVILARDPDPQVVRFDPAEGSGKLIVLIDNMFI